MVHCVDHTILKHDRVLWADHHMVAVRVHIQLQLHNRYRYVINANIFQFFFDTPVLVQSIVGFERSFVTIKKKVLFVRSFDFLEIFFCSFSRFS